MEKLSSPVTVESHLGPVQATHIAHNYSVQEIGDRRITSTRQYCVMVNDELRPISQASTCDITGGNLDSLGEDPTGSQILAKHLELNSAAAEEQSKQLNARREALQKEIAAAEERLEALRGQKA